MKTFMVMACLWVASLFVLQSPNDEGATKQNRTGSANPSTNIAHAKSDASNSLPNGTVVNCNQQTEPAYDTSRAALSNGDIEIQRQLATFTKYLFWVGAAQAFILGGTLFLIWRQANLMKTHADHFDKLARATASQVNLMEAQFDQWVVLTSWKIWKQASDGMLRVAVDLANPSQFPITLDDGILIFERWGTVQTTKYLLGQKTFISPNIPHVIEFNPGISAEQPDSSVAFSISGHFVHFHRISKQPVTQRLSGRLDCTRWSSDHQWHATFTPYVHMNPEPAEKTEEAK
jgi:hypothetical protein